MKKVILSAAALMIGAVSFAQVQVGGNEAAQASPVANNSSDQYANTGKAVQTGNGQEVSVIQVGAMNSSRSTQGDGTGTGDNKIRVEQSGPELLGLSWAFVNEAEAHQKGTDNQATFDQESAGNDGRIDQGLSETNSSGNKAAIEQGFDGDQFFEITNYSYLQQDGTNNSAFSKQTNDNNDAWVDQEGNANRASVVQHSTPSLSEEFITGDDMGNSSFVVQDGPENQARVNQSTDGARNEADLRQYGNRNKAQQIQINPSQHGQNGNTASIRQGIQNVHPDYARWAEAYQTQNGARNSADIAQNDNKAGERTYAEQNQEGNDNEASINQQGFTGPGSGGTPRTYSYAKQNQIGHSNDATLTQDGAAGSIQNQAYQLQSGENNFVNSSQYGENNRLNTLQYGDQNYATTHQTGSSNAALVVQYDGQSFDVIQDGNGNMANVHQAGMSGGATVTGLTFDPMNTWTEVPEVPAFDPADL